MFETKKVRTGIRGADWSVTMGNVRRARSRAAPPGGLTSHPWGLSRKS